MNKKSIDNSERYFKIEPPGIFEEFTVFLKMIAEWRKHNTMF